MAVAVERLQQFEQAVLQGSDDDPSIGYGLSISGHSVIVLLLLIGIFERVGPVEVPAVPIEIVLVVAPAAPSASFAVADVEKQANAPLGTISMNGIDQPLLPGIDGADRRGTSAEIPVQDEGELARGDPSATSEKIVNGPLGPAPLPAFARVPGVDALTAIPEPKVHCGAMAQRQIRPAPVKARGKVLGILNETSAMTSRRLTQVVGDRRENPSYRYDRMVLIELENEPEGSPKRAAVNLPPGFVVNVGDEIELNRAYVDPSDPCQFIPSLAIRRL